MNVLEKKEKELNRIASEKQSLIQEIKPTQAKISKLQLQMDNLREEINRLKNEPRVSDHAVIRLLERMYGFDFEEHRKYLLTNTVRDAILMGATRVKKDGYTLVIKNNTIVTILD